MGTTQTESPELTSAPGRVGQAPGNSQAREEASLSPVVISKDGLPKPALPAPREERGTSGERVGGGTWGPGSKETTRGVGTRGAQAPRRLSGEPAGAGMLGGTRGPGSPAPQPSALLLAPSVQVAGHRFSLRLFLKDIYLAAPGLSCGA